MQSTIQSNRGMLWTAGLWVLVAGGLSSVARGEFPYDREPIQYAQSAASDPVARLQKKIDSGELKLEYDAKRGYLPAVLKALAVPVSSQALVFAKDSFQRTKIDREHPRAVYFNDEVYVGFVQHSDLLEFGATDPQLGATFYSLEQHFTEKPKFTRHTDECLTCHSTGRTLDVPGFFIRSVVPDPTGEPVYRAGTFDVHHSTPLKQRWGGWYVTGKHGAQEHMGNVWLASPDKSEKLETAAGANLVDLSKLIDTSPYLSPQSDIVALMVLEHQARLQTLLVHANFDGRSALWYNAELNKAFQQPKETVSESTQHRLEHAAKKLVSYMLFTDETPLAAPIEGSGDFTREFQAQGPRDSKGRSLREFDLKERIFKYPLSYLIYSPQFEGLPAEVKTIFFRELYDILKGKSTGPESARSTPAQRQAILEILRDTKPNLPDYYRS